MLVCPRLVRLNQAVHSPVTLRLRTRDVIAYRICDDLSGVLICLMVLFSPWAFGTTEPWSVWTMNFGGYALGLLLTLKLGLRWFKGHSPPRWDAWPGHAGSPRRGPAATWTRRLAWLTVLILAWCVVSALNARATYFPAQLSFEYHECLRWLPHSFDRTSTWLAFWTYLGLACSFWATRDWLLGKSAEEERSGAGRGDSGADRADLRNHGHRHRHHRHHHSTVPEADQTIPSAAAEAHLAAEVESAGEAGLPPHERSNRDPAEHRSKFYRALLPARLRLLLWLLAVNGGLLGIESIIQRLEDSPRLLFLVEPAIHKTAHGQFGPYAYRSNAAQYFNLLWPVCLAFWWILNRSASHRDKTHHVVLVCAAVIAACPIVSTSRAGAAVTVGIAAAGAFLLLGPELLSRSRNREKRLLRRVTMGALLLFFTAALALGLALGWTSLKPRLRAFEMDTGFDGREELYEIGRQIAGDYPIFGTGPGTYESVSELYRPAKLIGQFYTAQVHNDWLETRITFGWVGSGIIYAMLAIVFLRWFAPGGIHGGRRFILMLWLALAGCLAHARYDFPFQVHSVVFLFLLLCAIAMTLTRRAR